MPLENRTASCDICGVKDQEIGYGHGWPGWVIVNGIGARKPEPDEPITNVHTEMYACPECREHVSIAINRIQKEYKA